MGGGPCKCVTRLSAFPSEGVSFSKTEIHGGRAFRLHTHRWTRLPSQPLGDQSPIATPWSVSAHSLSGMMLWTQLLLECGSVAFTLWECCLLTSEAAAGRVLVGSLGTVAASVVRAYDVLAQRHRALLCSK